ncbi:hypothetical protein B0H66DRAFT_105494 [Apodospora peruviana]|uniref:FAD-binding domain-containing protein n=1 Tax=Apodospora peruviana TaxID=516989 RepID=A0AAE0MAD8_9PEZI|nr:hypothetical protein B0H66DRAFT_105494 [Apodospora peruviana]
MPSATNGNGPTSPQQTQQNVHVLIIGGGITGLILAQGLRKFNASPAAATYPIKYTFTVYERDPDVFYRGGGYSLSFHWSLPFLEDAVPQDIVDGIPGCLCNPHGEETGQLGKFQYLNLHTAVPKVVVERRSISRIARVSREKLLKLLMTGIDMHFSKQLADLTWPDHNTVTAHFADGTSATGNLLVGADGSSSAVRRVVCGPDRAKNLQLPVRMMGFRTDYPLEKVARIRELDPNLIMGGDPELNTYFWFSFLNMPRPESGVKVADCHMMVSWPTEDPYPGGGKAPTIPPTNEERQALVKELSSGWAECLKEMVMDIPKSAEMREIGLYEWYPRKGDWDSRGGRVTLVGDAAHSIAPFRGEAVNHGVVDVANLLNMLIGKKKIPDGQAVVDGRLNLGKIVEAYEDEMIERVEIPCKRASKACIDANHYEDVKEGSFFTSPRQMNLK